MFLDILTICLLIMFALGLRPVKDCDFSSDFFSKDKTLAVKGVVVLIPIIKHLYDTGANGGTCTYILSNIAEVAPCMFFVISGYGLMKQHLIKENYSKGFLIKRFPKVLVPYILATLIMVVANFVFNGFLYWPKDIIHAILCGDPIVKYSWYVIHILLFYLWFYFLVKICGKNPPLLIIGGIAYYVLSTILFMNMGFGMHWWGTSFALAAGMFVAAYEKEIFEYFKSRYAIKAIAYVLVMVLVFYEEPRVIFGLHLNELFPTNSLFELLICCGVIILLIRFTVGNPVSSFLGKYSYEIYILQGLFIVAGNSAKLHLEGNVYIIFVLIGSVVGGVALYYVDKFILSKIIRV